MMDKWRRTQQQQQQQQPQQQRDKKQTDLLASFGSKPTLLFLLSKKLVMKETFLYAVKLQNGFHSKYEKLEKNQHIGIFAI